MLVVGRATESQERDVREPLRSQVGRATNEVLGKATRIPRCGDSRHKTMPGIHSLSGSATSNMVRKHCYNLVAARTSLRKSWICKTIIWAHLAIYELVKTCHTHCDFFFWHYKSDSSTPWAY